MDMTAGQMQAEGLCVGSCMVANGPHTSACRCNCNGEWHGALRDVVVRGTAWRRKPLPAPQDGPDMFRDADYSEPCQGVLCEQCAGLVNPKQAGAGFVRCTRCDPFGTHTAITPGGPCQLCVTDIAEPALAGSAPN